MCVTVLVTKLTHMYQHVDGIYLPTYALGAALSNKMKRISISTTEIASVGGRRCRVVCLPTRMRNAEHCRGLAAVMIAAASRELLCNVGQPLIQPTNHQLTN